MAMPATTMEHSTSGSDGSFLPSSGSVASSSFCLYDESDDDDFLFLEAAEYPRAAAFKLPNFANQMALAKQAGSEKLVKEETTCQALQDDDRSLVYIAVSSVSYDRYRTVSTMLFGGIERTNTHVRGSSTVPSSSSNSLQMYRGCLHIVHCQRTPLSMHIWYTSGRCFCKKYSNFPSAFVLDKPPISSMSARIRLRASTT